MQSYNAQLFASLPDGHPLKNSLSPMANVNANYGQLNPMAGQPPAPPPVMPAAVAGPPPPPPPAPMPPPVAPPVSVASAEPPRVQPPQPAGPRIFNTGGSPAHEVRTMGDTQSMLMKRRDSTLADTAGIVRDEANQAALKEAMDARVRIDDATKRQAEAAASKQSYQDQMDMARANIDRTTAEVAKGPEAVKESAGDKVIAGIALALGAMGASLNGGPNYAMQIVNKKADDQVAQKRAEWEAKKDKLGAQKSQFGNLVQQYGVDGAEDILRAAHTEQIAAQMQESAASRGINQNNAAFAQTLGNIQAQADEYKAKAGIKYVQATAGQQMVLDQRTGVPVPLKEYASKQLDHVNKLDVVDAENDAKFQLKQMDGAAKKDADRASLYVATDGGKGFFAPTEDEAKKARAVMTAKESLVPILSNLRAIRGKIGRFDIGSSKVTGRESPEIAQFKSDQAQVVVALKNLDATGALDKGAVDNAVQMMGGDTLKLLANPEAFDTVMATLESRINKRADALTAGGAQSAKQSIGRDSSGNVVTKPQGLYETGAPTPGMPATRPLK